MDYKKSPGFLKSFLSYKINVKGHSVTTANGYCFDLCQFFEFLYRKKGGISLEETVDLNQIDLDFIKTVTTDDIYEYLLYLAAERGNQAATRARRLSSIRGFFKYLVVKENVLLLDPSEHIDSPKISKALPKYLNLKDSRRLLDTVKDSGGTFAVRDYAIITLFLNCGLRLSELVRLNLSSIDFQERTARIIGKGNKERILYINDAVISALLQYLPQRHKTPSADKDALFLSRLNKRISPKTVQWIVYKYLDEIGLSGRNLSVHKLRHTAATLIYNTGRVDIRVLKDILGHEQLNTTQIYTHVSDEQLKMAIDANPLSEKKEK